MKRAHQESITPSRLVEIIPSAVYTPAEASAYLRLKTQTLELWRRTGQHPELRYRRVGRRIVYLGSDILDFLNRALEKPKAGAR